MGQEVKENRQRAQIPATLIYIGKALQLVSKKLAAFYAGKLFVTPVKFKTPHRELAMDKGSVQKLLYIPALNKNVMVYEYGNSGKKVLLSHGWSGRGTQLVKIADSLLANGYSTISFDAPAHGKSPGRKTNMKEFIEVVLEIEKQYGPFEAAIGHSLGGMAILNAWNTHKSISKLVTIGSGNVIDDIIADFISQLGLKPAIGPLMKQQIENRLHETIHRFSAYIAAQTVTVPVLVIHDTEDVDVPVAAAKHIHENLSNGKLIITQGLGHRKILGDKKVIDEIMLFLKK